MKIVTAAEMREIDRVTAERFGAPSLTLMENAGRAVAEFVLRSHSGDQRILILCGKGNNGGDGFVVGRLLHERGKPVQLILLADPAELKGDAAVMYGKLPMPAIIVRSSEELKGEGVLDLLSSDIVVDAILGTGFKPPVTGLYADAIAAINASKAKVIAVDIPSGAEADAMAPQQGTIARADLIVTFTAPRARACIRYADRRHDLCCGYWVSGRGDRLITSSESDSSAGLRELHRSAPSGVE